MARIVMPTMLARMVDTDNISQTQTYLACIKARSTLYALRVPQESEHTACPAAYILHLRIKFICICWLTMRALTLVGDLRPCHACVAAPNSSEGLQASDETSEEAGVSNRNTDTRGAANELSQKSNK